MSVAIVLPLYLREGINEFMMWIRVLNVSFLWGASYVKDHLDLCYHPLQIKEQPKNKDNLTKQKIMLNINEGTKYSFKYYEDSFNHVTKKTHIVYIQ